MTAEPMLRVDGVALASSGLPYGDLSWSDRADGGNIEASWSMATEYGSRPTPLVKDATVEIYLGLTRRWYGELTGLDWDEGTFTATGMSQRAPDFTALGVGLATSTVPNTIVDNAIARGWRATRTASISTSPVVVGDATAALNYVGPILDQRATNTNQHWGIWGDGAVRFYSFPTVYDYRLAPGVIELGETTEDTFNVVLCAYTNSTTGLPAYVASGFVLAGRREHVEDLTTYGPMSAATAQAISDNVLAAGAASPGWTTSVEVSSAQLTAGGVPVDLAAVTAGQMVRAAVTGDYGSAYRDLVIGETKYDAGADVITLSPTAKVATSLSEVIEDAYTRITGLPVAA